MLSRSYFSAIVDKFQHLVIHFTQVAMEPRPPPECAPERTTGPRLAQITFPTIGRNVRLCSSSPEACQARLSIPNLSQVNSRLQQTQSLCQSQRTRVSRWNSRGSRAFLIRAQGTNRQAHSLVWNTNSTYPNIGKQRVPLESGLNGLRARCALAPLKGRARSGDVIRRSASHVSSIR